MSAQAPRGGADAGPTTLGLGRGALDEFSGDALAAWLDEDTHLQEELLSDARSMLWRRGDAAELTRQHMEDFMNDSSNVNDLLKRSEFTVTPDECAARAAFIHTVKFTVYTDTQICSPPIQTNPPQVVSLCLLAQNEDC